LERRKAPESVKTTFEQALPDDPRVARKHVFGYPCAFVNGNMFAGVHQESLFLRLAEEDRAALLAQPGAGLFEPMPGRAMREYVVVPPSLVADPDRLRQWVAAACNHGASLPPKSASNATAKKPRRSRASPGR